MSICGAQNSSDLSSVPAEATDGAKDAGSEGGMDERERVGT